MRTHRTRGRLAVAALAMAAALTIVAAAGCTTAGDHATSDTHPSRSNPPDGSTPGPLPTTLVLRCPVTLPRPVPASQSWRSQLFGSDSAAGNGEIWVGGLPPGGVIDAGPQSLDTDGLLSVKFGWFRAVPGRLQITGHRLDGAAPPLRSHVPDGYGDIGFQSSGVYFPGPGCWQVTGTVGSASLTFVTWVVMSGTPPAGTR